MTKKIKVLIIRFSSIGDIVLTSPVIRCLKKQIDAEVHYLTKPQFSAIPLANPMVDKVIDWDDNKSKEILEILRNEKYDWVSDLHHNLRSLKIKSALRRPGKSFPKLNFEKWLLVNFKIDRLPDIHIVQRCLSTVTPLGIRDDGEGLEYHIPPQEEHDLAQYGLSVGKFAAIAVGAAHATKCLENDQISRLADALSMPVVLLGGPPEKERGSWIAENASSGPLNLCGALSIHESASVVKQAGVVISPDTAMMHMAAAFRRPLISVWGNTVPGFGMYPYYGNQPGSHYVFEIKGLPCRPCSKIGFDKCPKGHFRCIRNLDMLEISSRAKLMVSEDPSPEKADSL